MIMTISLPCMLMFGYVLCLPSSSKLGCLIANAGRVQWLSRNMFGVASCFMLGGSAIRHAFILLDTGGLQRSLREGHRKATGPS
jgi:hypothetical protein